MNPPDRNSMSYRNIKSRVCAMAINARVGGAIAVAILLLVCSASAALAHAQLRSASPAAGSAVPTAPAEIAVSFSETLEPAFSSIIVRDAAGRRVDKADSHLDQGDRTTLRVSLPPLAPGTYTVDWKAVTADTHRMQGSYTFRVGQ